MNLHKRGYGKRSQLLDVVAFASFVAANPSLTTRVAPAAGSILNTNGLFRSHGVKGSTNGFIAMDANEMATQVVLPAERTTT